MDIDLPEVVAEVSGGIRALRKGARVQRRATLDELFRDDPRTIRYGANEILYGYAEIKSFRAARSPVALARKLSRT